MLKTTDIFMNFRIWLNKFKLPGAMFYSKYIYLPDPNVEITVVVGKPMKLPKIVEPKPEIVDKYHNIYI